MWDCAPTWDSSKSDTVRANWEVFWFAQDGMETPSILNSNLKLSAILLEACLKRASNMIPIKNEEIF